MEPYEEHCCCHMHRECTVKIQGGRQAVLNQKKNSAQTLQTGFSYQHRNNTFPFTEIRSDTLLSLEDTTYTSSIPSHSLLSPR